MILLLTVKKGNLSKKENSLCCKPLEIMLSSLLEDVFSLQVVGSKMES